METEVSAAKKQLFKNDEEILEAQVENLKKENFSLKSSIQAWKATYEKKQNELREAESKLNEIYNQIWSEREKFCAKADKFNNQYGILSGMWKEKMDEILNFLPEEKCEKCQEKSQNLEMKIEEEQKEVEVLEVQDEIPEVLDEESQGAKTSALQGKEASKESSSSPGNKSKHESPVQENGVTESLKTFNESGAMEFNDVPKTLESSENQKNGRALESIFSETNPQVPKKKKVRFSKENDTIEIFDENPSSLKMKFFSVVDMETVKKANRLKSKRKYHLPDHATNRGMNLCKHENAQI